MGSALIGSMVLLVAMQSVRASRSTIVFGVIGLSVAVGLLWNLEHVSKAVMSRYEFDQIQVASGRWDIWRTDICDWRRLLLWS